jgi:serine/threonine protein kinase
VDGRLVDLLIWWEEARRQGRTLSAEELCRDCPDLVEEARRQIEALWSMDHRLHTNRSASGSTPSAEMGPAAADFDRLKPGAEPIRGYRLLERLGRGGFGEVWKARAPGGFHVALKFVPATGKVGETETRALKIMRLVRHPNLVHVFGAWQYKGLLVAAMELADRTLWDRFQEARSQGLSGIPSHELLEYFLEAAKGIDYLNAPEHGLSGKGKAGIQHRDIKPQNILMFGGGVKIGDFGLARLVTGSVSGHTGSLTVAYAAPEFFNGQTARTSDQYSLAVTWCVLRAGQLPFPGVPAGIVAGHLNWSPDLSRLLERERAVVARALAKNPAERWPTCRYFVESLRGCFLPVAVPILDPPTTKSAESTESAGSLQRTAPHRWPVLALIFSLLLAVGLLSLALFLRPFDKGTPRDAWKPGNHSASDGPYEFPRQNVRLQVENPSWKEEAGIKHAQTGIKAVLVLRREEPNSWLALLAQDYKDRTPQDGELVDEGVRRLREFFDGFEYEVKDKQKESKLAGQRAVHMDFLGQVNELPMVGECWALGYKGFGYWVVTWAPAAEGEQVAADWEGLRKGFVLLKERDGWNGPVVTEATLAGTKAGYTLTYVEGLWEKQKPGDYDARAEAALLGHDQADPGDTARTATALVLLLDKADDLKAAVAAARAHLEKRQKSEYPETTIEEVQEKNPKEGGPDRAPDEIGNVRGRLLRLHVSNGENRERFVYLAVVAQPEQVVAVQCDCAWRRRAYWETNFDQLLRKFALTVANKDIGRPDATKPPPKPDKVETEKPGFPRRALVISVNNYLFFSPTNYGQQLRNSRQNVRWMINRFSEGLHIPLNQIAELSDAAVKDARPTLKPVIEATLKDFLNTSRPQDCLLVMFIGHYVEMGDDVFLVPMEGDREDPKTLIPLKDVYAQLAACKSRQKVLVLDVCRFNPGSGLERPGSGPMGDDVKVPGAMGPKLEAMLKAPPEGVQVWSACSKEQQSLELSDSNLDNGVFVDCLTRILENGFEGIQKPEKLMPIDPLVESVNFRMKAFLEPYKRTQVAMLSGKPLAEGAAYDPKEPAPPLPEIKGRERDPELERLVADILNEITAPPLKFTREEMRLRPEALALFFTMKDLQAYKFDNSEDTEFRKAVKNARKVLIEKVSGKKLREEFPVPGDPMKFKLELQDYQTNDLSKMQTHLSLALDGLKEVANEKANEPKVWQATYDYILARVEAQVAYLYEYQTLLGAMRKDFPPYEPKVHNGWRIASKEALEGDKTGQNLAKDARKILDKITKDYPATPWAILAKRDRLTNLGLEWQATKIGGQ